MTANRQRAATLAIWGLLVAFGVLQAAAWIRGTIPREPWATAQMAAGWIVMVILATIATRRIDRLVGELSRSRDEQRATKNEIEQLQTHNAMLEVLTRTVDVPLAFQSIAPRIARIVSCDRVGLALLTEAGDEFQTYTARLNREERRSRPRPEVMFKLEGTAIGSAVKSRQPLIIDDTAARPEFLDANVAHSSGFASALVIPLVSKDVAIGTLNVVSRRPAAFTEEDVRALLPVTEIFAMAHVAQRLQLALARHQTVESMTELTLSVATEINSALQTIIGHCDLIERGYPDTGLHRDLATVVRQAQRISALLDKMRSASHHRLNEAAQNVRGVQP